MIRLRPSAWVCALLTTLCLITAAQAAPERGPAWVTLTQQQQQTLAPLQREWASIDATRKQKWIEVAAKFPSMPADERQRVQTRMADWARLTPTERAGARMQFQEVRRLPADERQARWQAYQALSPEERGKLAQSAKPALRAASPVDTQARVRSTSDVPNGKRNMVRAPAPAPTRVVAPTVVQAKPGATTTTMSTRSPTPSHNQPGLPKIAATPGFVDSATLLPRRGPQGAAVRAAASSDPTAQP